MACAIEAQRAGFRSVLVDKGCLCNSLFHYPAHMTFFTTSELLEIGDIPFPSTHAKPTRDEALEYYRKVAMFYKLDIRTYSASKKSPAKTSTSPSAPATNLAATAPTPPAKSSSPPATTTCPT
jgi:hypothetical protein